jgi:LDH2 family malate/lactate/ureidoglycolate dehydrogenase
MAMTLRFDAQALRELATAAFESAGMTTADAALTADTLVAADLRGVMSHGMVRLPVYVRNLRDGSVSPTAQPVVISDSPSTALFDGQNAMGQVVGVRAMDLAIEKARASGVASVGARHSNHFGTCAYYALRAAQQNMIGIATTNGAAAMAPWGAIEPLVGNNPLAIAAPAGPSPIVLDMAMTVVARGKIRLAQLRGEPLPTGWGFDKLGHPSQDPGEVLNGSLAPVGGYKGYGLAVVVDLLTAVLTGAALSPELENMGFTAGAGGPTLARGPEPPGQGTGHWFLALDIAAFLPLDEFERRAAGYAALLHAAPRAEGTSAIYLPGEPELATERDRLAHGIPYEESVIEELRALAADVGLSFPVSVASS